METFKTVDNNIFPHYIDRSREYWNHYIQYKKIHILIEY
jgi:hypothetical protein